MNATEVNAKITTYLRARHTLICVSTVEEKRARTGIQDANANAKYETRVYDCKRGITTTDGNVLSQNGDPSAALDFIRDRKERAVYVLLDFHKWWADPVVLRALCNLHEDLQNSPANEARSIIVLTSSREVPPELSAMKFIEYPLADRAEVARLLDDTINRLPEFDPKTNEPLRANAAPNGTRDKAIDMALGLTTNAIEDCYADSLVISRTIDPALVMADKKLAIKAQGVTVYDPDPRGLDAIGGYEVLKSWVLSRKAAFSPKAKAYGLPAPRGLLLVGPPGSGKSLTAKCVGTALGMPLLRGDLVGTQSKYVGESGSNLRKMLAIVEAMAPCVFWIDEIEKVMAGATGQQGDGGVAADMLGTLLSWMQEKTAPVFVVATANDVRALPPELLRKGRFDEMFFVDLPMQGERVAIIKAALAQYKRTPERIDLVEIANVTDGFTGAEISAMVPDAMFAAFADNEREITTEDLKYAASTVVPISKTASEKLQALREWAKGRARPASLPETTTSGTARSLDL